MTRKERVVKALKHEETEVLPYNIDYTPPVAKALREYFKTDDEDEALGNHIYMMKANDPKPLYADPETYGSYICDHWGVVWTTSDYDRGHVYEYPIKEATKEALDKFNFPDPYKPGRFDGIGKDIEKYKERFILGVAGDLWERAYFMVEFSQLLTALYLEPEFVLELLDRIVEFDLVNIKEISRHPIDGIFISDDYGIQQSLQIKPQQWKYFIMPRLKKLIDACKEKNLCTILHSCGNVYEIVGDLIEIGLDVLHPIQPEAMDVYGLKKKFGKDISFFGGISTQRLLSGGTPMQVREEVSKAKRILGKDGGYIIAPGITIQRDCPVENIIALMEEAKAIRL